MGRWTGVKLCPHSGCKFYMEIFESKLLHRHPCASGSGGRVGGWPSYGRDREGAILGKEAPEPGLGGGRAQTGSGNSKFYSVGSTDYSINWGGEVPREKGVEGHYGHISSAVVFSLLQDHWELYCMGPGLPRGSDGQESACNAEDLGSFPGSGGSPVGGNGYPLQYSCPENPMGRGAWWATVHGVAELDTTK